MEFDKAKFTVTETGQVLRHKPISRITGLERQAKEWANKNSCCIDGGKCCANVTEAFQAGFEHGLAEGRKENAELKAFCSKLIKANNELRDSLRKYEIVPDVVYLPNGAEVYKENVGNNPYGVK